MRWAAPPCDVPSLITPMISYSSSPQPEHPVEDYLLGFPDQGHSNGEGGEAEEKQKDGVPDFDPAPHPGSEAGCARRQEDKGKDRQQEQNQQPLVELRELPGLMPQ